MMSPPRKPRILLANSVRIWAGGERFLLDVAKGLHTRGYEVWMHGYPGSPICRRARKAGIRVHEVRTRANGAPWTVYPLIGWLEHQEIDILLSNYEKDLRTAAWAAHLAQRPIAVLHSQECDADLKNRFHNRYFHGRVVQHMIANSQATCRRMHTTAPELPEGKITVIPKGIDLQAFAAGETQHWRKAIHTGAGPLLGFAGQLVERKRCGHLLEILAGAEFAGLPWHLAIAGSGPLRSQLEVHTQQLGLQQRVTFCEQVSDMENWMAAIDVLVLPSLVEGFGYVLAEAAAAGKPAVAYDSSSMGEVVEDAVTGLLARPEHPMDFAGSIHRLILQEDLRRKLGAQAQEKARQEFSMDLMMDRLEKVLLKQWKLCRLRRFPLIAKA